MTIRKSTSLRVLAFLYIGYFASRIYALTLLPVFVDEGIHIHWAAGVWRGEVWQPLFYSRLLQVWLTALVVPWAPDPLWASRFISVLSGGVTVGACYEIGRRLYDEKIGLLSAGLYIISPFALFYDRMALADGILSTFAALTLLWSIALVREPKRKYIGLLCLSMALGILTKIPGLLLLLTPLLTGVLLRKAKEFCFWRHFGSAYLITLGLIAVPVVVWFNRTEVFADKSILGHGSVDLIDHFASNAKMIFESLWIYWTPPVVILGIVGYLMAMINRQREGFLLAWLTAFPIFGFALISRIWFPRYILFTAVPLFVLASWSLCHFISILDAWSNLRPWRPQREKVRTLFITLSIGVIFLPAFLIDRHLWTDPAQAPLPREERTQYIEEWSSGYGVMETSTYLHQEATKFPEGIILVRHGMGDATYFGLEVYLMREPKVALQRLDLHYPGSFERLSAWAERHPTFVVLTQPPVGNSEEDQPDMKRLLSMAKLERSYPKPMGRRVIELYRVQSRSPL